MRPALQRLLARPLSLDVLRYLAGPHLLQANHHHVAARWGLASDGRSRRHLTLHAVAVLAKYEERVDNNEPLAKPNGHVRESAPLSTDAAQQINRSKLQGEGSSSGDLDYGHWGRLLAGRLDFESDLGDPWASSSKLLNDRHNVKDGRLWARLLNYRQRTYGDAGILEFWEGVRSRNLWLPTRSRYADFCWQTIVKVALKNERMLWELCEYANAMLASTERRWSKLYTTITLHLLVNNQRTQAVRFHELLISRHPPSSREFSRLCRQVVIWKGDLRGLQHIYKGSAHRNVYGKIVPALCICEDFQAAFDWHIFLLKHQDVPADPGVVEPLLRFLKIYDTSKATEVVESLRRSGAPFALRTIEARKETLPLSREMMNVIHGKTFNISVKSYNDDLGARWFATKWISLDLAINAIHSLGVQEIGPLSLQAIALREPDFRNIVARIDQLKAIDVGLGSSLFSRAVERFAREQQHTLLDRLLQRDQHPLEYDNIRLQETILASYERARDWPQYNLTLAILQLSSKFPDTERENLMLRSLIANCHMPSILDRLSKMQDGRTVVTQKTLTCLIHAVLEPRQTGKLPVRIRQFDARRAIAILQSLMKTGTYIPPTAWREIIRRLGMLGHFGELERLCVFLALWHDPSPGIFSLSLLSPSPKYRIPQQVTTDHPHHPLRVLFPDSLQRAIVEWGFIHSMTSLPKPNSRSSTSNDRPVPQVTAGISLLKALREKGVYINPGVVNKAIMNRLLVYYGPGSSQRAYNRHARAKNPLTIEEMASQIDEALGQPVFTSMDLRQAVEERALRRAQKLRRQKQRSMERGIDGGGL